MMPPDTNPWDKYAFVEYHQGMDMRPPAWRNRMLVGDCLDVMAAMPDDCIDLVITSPPYGKARAHTYGGVDPDEYVAWFAPRAEQILRIMKPAGSFILNIKEAAPHGERLLYVIDLIAHLKRDIGFRWVEEYIWHKSSAMPGKWKYRFRDSWERLLHFSKTPDIKMRQESVMVPSAPATIRRANNLQHVHDYQRGVSATNPRAGRNRSAWIGREQAYPSNVIHRAAVTRDTGHSAAFPPHIPKFFTDLFTDPGDVVLDPFSGSGTTFDVAIQMGRCPVAIEIDPAAVSAYVERHPQGFPL